MHNTLLIINIKDQKCAYSLTSQSIKYWTCSNKLLQCFLKMIWVVLYSVLFCVYKFGFRYSAPMEQTEKSPYFNLFKTSTPKTPSFGTFESPFRSITFPDQVKHTYLVNNPVFIVKLQTFIWSPPSGKAYFQFWIDSERVVHPVSFFAVSDLVRGILPHFLSLWEQDRKARKWFSSGPVINNNWTKVLTLTHFI